jgi:hypothetical protein
VNEPQALHEQCALRAFASPWATQHKHDLQCRRCVCVCVCVCVFKRILLLSVMLYGWGCVD